MAETLPYLSTNAPPGEASRRRIDALDLLRGIAILGIFLMNTQSMSMPQDAYVNPASYSPEYVPNEGFPPFGEKLKLVEGANYDAYVFTHLFADMKFITIFSIMFGAGIVLQAERASRRGLNPWAVHYARMVVLLAFGMLHAYGLWYGDILVPYALCGMILAPLRRLPSRALMVCGLMLIACVSLISLANTQHWNFPFLQWFWDMSTQLYRGGNEAELDAYRGSWWHQMSHRAWEALRGQTADFATWTFLRCGGCMLLGMALQQWQFFHGRWKWWAYGMIAAVAIPVGSAITYGGIRFNNSIEWYEQWGEFWSLWGLGVEFNYWGSLVTAFGYMAVGVLVAEAAAKPSRRMLRAALVPIRAVGKTALSNYILQTLIATTLFYGHGFGLFGSVSRVELLEIVVPVWGFQLIVSTLWLKKFKQGPLEWLWHRIVYGWVGGAAATE
jgi:uncharacterized protein